MARAELSVFTDRDPDAVFAFVADPANNPRWRSYVIESRWLDDGPMRVGRRGYQTSRILGRRITVEAEVVGAEGALNGRIGRLLTPLAVRMMSRQARSSVQKLKTDLERRP